MTDLEEWGRTLAAARKAKGLSQTGLGDLIGVHFTTVSKWELGITLPTYKHALALKAEVGVEPPALEIYALRA